MAAVLKHCILRVSKHFLYFFLIQSVAEYSLSACQGLNNSSTGTPTTESIAGKANDLEINCDESSQTCTIILHHVTEFSQVHLIANFTESMFNIYSQNSSMTVDELKMFLTDVGVLPTHNSTDSHEEHSHSHDYSVEDYYDAFDYDEDYFSVECVETVESFLKEYYSVEELNNVKINLVDFYVMLPRILYDLQEHSCSESDHDSDHDHDHDHDHGHGEEDNKNRGKIWAIALGSVAIISALAVIGICIVPLMKHSIYFNRLISFLVALAVGTLIGDALLHLLPHSMGTHDHSSHGHGGHEEEDSEHGSEEQNVIYKSLMAVAGIYLFYLMESVMGLIRERKRRKSSMDNTPEKNNEKDQSQNTALLENGSPVQKVGGHGDTTEGTEDVKFSKPNDSDISIELPCQHHHHHPDLRDATGIKDMAWMIIMGDGLHNLSDGLAIGAAFSSSITGGLSTSLAIFCHELPHELGDFAILISAGMSIKQAIMYNVLSACCAFIGVVIGLAIGEFSESIKLWILAITAGGFLYVGLVGMLPQLLDACTKKDGFIRFVVQNVGLIMGILIMVFIALYEENFHTVFTAE